MKQLSCLLLPLVLAVVSLSAHAAECDTQQPTSWHFPAWLIAVVTLATVVAVPKAIRMYLESRKPLWDPKGKVIVITGASSGIGEELAYKYSKCGARMVLSARREKELAVVAEKCKSLGAQEVVTVIADVSVQEHCKNLIDTTVEKFGVIDCIILNAGISMGTSLENCKDLSIFRRLIDVNLYGCIDCTYYALPHLKKSSKPIIAVISSLAGKGPAPERTGYCASKFALHGFFDTLRMEVSKYGIQITMICPGFVQTNINESRLGDGATGFDKSKAIPVDEACEIITKAINSGKREVLFPLWGIAGQYLYFFFPELYNVVVSHGFERQFKAKKD